MDLPEDVAADAVGHFKANRMEEYFNAIGYLRSLCEHQQDLPRYLQAAGLPEAMMRRVRRRLSKGDVETARELFDRMQRYFGSAYVLRLDDKYGVSARLGMVASATV